MLVTLLSFSRRAIFPLATGGQIFIPQFVSTDRNIFSTQYRLFRRQTLLSTSLSVDLKRLLVHAVVGKIVNGTTLGLATQDISEFCL